MNTLAQWIGYGLMALTGTAAICGIAWLVTELVWQQIQRAQGVRYVLRMLAEKKHGIASSVPTVSAKPPASNGPDEQNPKDAP